MTYLLTYRFNGPYNVPKNEVWEVVIWRSANSGTHNLAIIVSGGNVGTRPHSPWKS